MIAMLSLVVCLTSQPHVCKTVIPDYVRLDTRQPMTFFECLGVGGQAVAARWLRDHPGYSLKQIQCSIATDEQWLRERLRSPEG